MNTRLKEVAVNRLRACMACMLLLLIFMPAASSAAPPVQLPTMGDPAEQYLSQSQERELGRQLMREVRLHMPVLQDPLVNTYIRDLGLRLAAHSDAPDQEFHFFVIDHPSINAFAMPGGYIGINSGLILGANSESELAGVIAHEIAHVTQRHLARRVGEAQRINLRTTAVILASLILASQDPEMASAAAMAGVAGSYQQQLNFSREHEHEADRVGMRILAAAGFDPMGMPDFFAALMRATRYRAQPPEWLSTHPLTEARIADTQSRAHRLQDKGDIYESQGFTLMQARLKVLAARSPDEAVNHFEQTRGDEHGVPALRYGLALALTRQGRLDQARKLLTDLLRHDGEEIAYLLALAELEMAAGKQEAALSYYAEAASLYPHNPAPRLAQAEALLQANQPEAARRLLNGAQPQAGDDPHFYWLLAQAASAADKPAHARLAMAEHYYLSGDLQPALNQLSQVTAANQADPYQIARAAARAEQLREEIRQRQQMMP